ncbi:CMP-N-acetylneuraminate-beta-galactosamide-alpha-2,3-sialyltransferase 1 [Tiliqua scincoides]|uniref:CMP-N-acetylneuraminate-beta-galactosamide- alpha-2,3-sialyltransferase 1 n=1 Tax=Tiliqua scincoides TaxID=71010 RepID=UPI003462BC1F
MLAVKKSSLKMFTLTLLFSITFTWVLLKYTDNAITFMWDPTQIVFQLSDQFKKLIKSSRRLCSCSTCISEQGVSLWFDERFNQTVQPFLTTQNAFMPEETYKWWLELQGRNCSKGIKETIQELFEIIPGDVDLLLEKESRCRRCAVVGNSGNLNQSQYGQEIDNHDFVFRMNKAPTVGFESDVGSKTTHHFVYPESYRELAENVSMVVIPFKILDLCWVISALTTGTINYTYVPVPSKIKANKDKILIYHPHFIKYVYDTWLQQQGRHPSTGFLSVIFALHICDEVDLYGFGTDSKGNWHHYWENNSFPGLFRVSGVHNGDFELNTTLTLASVNKIHIFMGR